MKTNFGQLPVELYRIITSFIKRSLEIYPYFDKLNVDLVDFLIFNKEIHKKVYDYILQTPCIIYYHFTEKIHIFHKSAVGICINDEIDYTYLLKHLNPKNIVFASVFVNENKRIEEFKKETKILDVLFDNFKCITTLYFKYSNKKSTSEKINTGDYGKVSELVNSIIFEVDDELYYDKNFFSHLIIQFSIKNFLTAKKLTLINSSNRVYNDYFSISDISELIIYNTKNAHYTENYSEMMTKMTKITKITLFYDENHYIKPRDVSYQRNLNSLTINSECIFDDTINEITSPNNKINKNINNCRSMVKKINRGNSKKCEIKIPYIFFKRLLHQSSNIKNIHIMYDFMISKSSALYIKSKNVTLTYGIITKNHQSKKIVLFK